MNLTNAVPRSGTKQNCLLYAPCTIPVPIQNVAQSEGGGATVFDKSVQHRSFSYLVAMPLLDSDSPASPCRTSG